MSNSPESGSNINRKIDFRILDGFTNNKTLPFFRPKGKDRFSLISGLDYTDKIVHSSPTPLKETSNQDLNTPRIDDLKRQNDELAKQGELLVAENRRLDTKVTDLKRKAKILVSENTSLSINNEYLTAKVKRLQEKVDELITTTSTSDSSDPKGFYRTLGIDPTLARTLPEPKFQRLLKSLYAAYANIHHPDTGGDTEAMKAVNNAHDFLKNSSSRRFYGK